MFNQRLIVRTFLCLSHRAAGILISGNPLLFSSSAPILDIVHMDHVCGNAQITATFVFCREGLTGR